MSLISTACHNKDRDMVDIIVAKKCIISKPRRGLLAKTQSPLIAGKYKNQLQFQIVVTPLFCWMEYDSELDLVRSEYFS